MYYGASPPLPAPIAYSPSAAPIIARFSRFLCHLCVFFISLFTILSVLIFLLLLRHYPSFHLTSSFALSPSSPCTLSDAFDVSLSATNTNDDKFYITFDSVTASVSYGDREEALAMTKVQLVSGHSQETFNGAVVPLRASLAVSNAKPEVAEGIAGDLERESAVEFNFRFAMVCSLERRWWWWWSKEVRMGVCCHGVKLVFPNDTATAWFMVDPSQSCVAYAGGF